jgi:hypothetical protein
LFYPYPQVKHKKKYNVTPCYPVDSYKCFRGTCLFYLKREAADFSEALAAVYSLTSQKAVSFIVPAMRI